MRVVDVKPVVLRGSIMSEGEFWEERMVRPLDVYPEFRGEGPILQSLPRFSEREVEVRNIYLEVHADNGLVGVSGPISSVEAYIIEKLLRKLIIGRDPLEFEKIWDVMYRYSVHGRKGETMMAISAVDCALWDLIGKASGKPVYRLLGGPSRDRLRAYASMLGFSLRKEDVIRRCGVLLEEGYAAVKWFMRYGPSDGVYGVERNLDLIKTIRDCVGYDVDLMIDCWMGWSVQYALKMARRLEKYEIAWIEEPLMPDDIDGYAELAYKLETPIAGGEHEYTRWGFKELIKRKAVDILQPDIMWAGGITETLKICDLASANGLPVIPHTSFMATTVNILFAKPEALCPIAEYLVKWNIINQAFYKDPMIPEKGYFKPPEKPGLGIEFDENKIKEKRNFIPPKQ